MKIYCRHLSLLLALGFTSVDAQTLYTPGGTVGQVANASGNVGIGTNNPGNYFSKLEVLENGFPARLLGDYDLNTAIVTIGGTSNNVGIGTTNLTHKLNVNGTVRARK